MQTNILLIRHGETQWNRERRWQGHTDVELTEKGESQAYAASQKVGTVDVIVTSPLKRAARTASIISDSIGIGPVVEMPELMERDTGLWSGKTREEIDVMAPGWEQTGHRPQGWEDDSEFLERVLNGLHAISIAFEGQTVLVTSHSGVLINIDRHFGFEFYKYENLAGRVLTAQASGDLQIGDRLSLIDAS